MKATKVTLKAKEGAAPGWPGFLAWLAAVHPNVYSAVEVAQPDLVDAIETAKVSPGARLNGLNFASDPEWAWNLGGPAAVVAGGSIPNANPAAVVVEGTGATSRIQSLIQTVTQAGAAYLSLDQQKRVLNMQLDRARQGLPPLDVGAYLDPNQGLNVGINQSTQRTILLVAAGLGGVFLLSRLLKR